MLNQTTRDWHTRVVTLSPSASLRINSAKGLTVRFFAMLRMTLLNCYIVMCTNGVCFDLGNEYPGNPFEKIVNVEGLMDIIPRPELPRFLLDLWSGVRGENDHWCGRGGPPNTGEYADTIESWHRQIGQH